MFYEEKNVSVIYVEKSEDEKVTGHVEDDFILLAQTNHTSKLVYSMAE